MVFSIGLILFSILFCIISLKIIKIRREEKIAIGVEGSKKLIRFTSAQRNLFEYSIIFLLQLLVLEFLRAHFYITSALLIVFIAARITHFISLVKIEPKLIKSGKSVFRLRVISMQITLLAIISASIAIAVLIV